MVFFAILSLYLGATRASTIIHAISIKNLLRNPMAFFDSTPLGRILNRFTQDVDEIDEELPSTIHALLNCLYMVLFLNTHTIILFSSFSKLFSKILLSNFTLFPPSTFSILWCFDLLVDFGIRNRCFLYFLIKSLAVLRSSLSGFLMDNYSIGFRVKFLVWTLFYRSTDRIEEFFEQWFTGKMGICLVIWGENYVNTGQLWVFFGLWWIFGLKMRLCSWHSWF